MADLALLEDLANHALRREWVFKERADLFNESTEWLLSRYCFLCHDFGEDVYIHVIIKGGVVTIYGSLEAFLTTNDHERERAWCLRTCGIYQQ